MRALAGDVGGTKTRLGIFAGGALLDQEDFLSCDYGGLAQIAKVFLTRHPGEVSIACFGIAGPVINERVETVNLPWAVERQAISAALGLDAIVLINDLEATGWGLLSLPPESFVQIKDGHSAAGNVALIAAGTGLGEAGLFYNGTEHRVSASEGGHVTFAPENELEVALYDYLRPRFGHVSWERVISGQGLVNLHSFLVTYHKQETPEWLAQQMRESDAAAAIAQAADSGRCEVCEEATSLMVELYGRKAGDLALTLKATGGVYLGGGIAPKMLERLSSGLFQEAFVAKGRMRRLLETIPVWVIMDDRAALVGAGQWAVRAKHSFVPDSA
jgi:glucokinase